MSLAAMWVMASIDGLSLFALAPSEALGRTVAEDYGIALAPHELRRFEDGEHKNGDLETLGHIARELAAFAQEPLHCKLAVLADMCREDPDQAVAAWIRLKEQVLRQGQQEPVR